MIFVITSGLLIAATILSGFLAGATADRMVVQMPAWKRIGPMSWAEYSRHADLANGFYFYPSLAIATTILNILATIYINLEAMSWISASYPVYLTTLLDVSGLIVTNRAAPIMLSLRRIDDDPAAVKKAFVGFDRWGKLRATFQIAAFFTNIWALIECIL